MKNNQRILFLILVIGIVVLLSACLPKESDVDINESNEPESTQTSTEGAENSDSNNGYPISAKIPSEEVSSNAYPISTDNSPDGSAGENPPEEDITPIVIPTPNADSGVVHGMIYSLTNDEPISYTKIYLATKIPVDPGDEYMVSIQENSSPHAQSNSNGEFVITDIEPGEYILVLVTPISTLPILDINNEQIEFSIEAGELIDFNDIYAYWPNF
jgi:hypothetical protein